MIENAGDELAPNSSPPIGRDTPSPELVKRQPKPGAKTVRWMDWTTARPLDYVREFEVDPNERGGLRSAGKYNFSHYMPLYTFKIISQNLKSPVVTLMLTLTFYF